MGILKIFKTKLVKTIFSIVQYHERIIVKPTCVRVYITKLFIIFFYFRDLMSMLIFKELKISCIKKQLISLNISYKNNA